MESSLKIRQSGRMRDRRMSIAGARYFLTICTRNRNSCLLEKESAGVIFSQLEHQGSSGDVELLCGMIMPDHFHLIFRLGSKITLGQVVAKFKAKTKSEFQWQEGYYEHRIRPDEPEENYAFYVFMNPYIGERCRLDERWDWWKRWRDVPYEFEALLDDGGMIPPSWVIKEESIRANLSVGS